jgi:serine protease Do
MPNRPIIAALVLAALAGSLGAQAGRDSLRDDLDFARSKIYPALVNISVVAKIYAGGRVNRAPAAGSGVIVSPAGHVLTNYHVAGEAARVTCTLPSGETIGADIVAPDAPTDLCVLKLRLDERADRSKPLPFATLGDSDLLQVGDYVIAVGNPLTLSSSMTLGIVSNVKRVFTDFTGTELQQMDIEGQSTGMFTRWIQHDALILPGNSGGPLVNLRGEIVGINTRGGNGVGFATPSILVAKILNQVLAYGEVRRGWIGVSVMPVGKLGRRTGALISAVAVGSPADKAGIKPGMILTGVNGEPLSARFFEEVPVVLQRIAELAPGERSTFSVVDGSAERQLELEVELMERSIGEEIELRELGITAQDVTKPMAQARRYPDADGVVLTGLRPGKPFESAEPKLDEGDVVTHLGGRPVRDLAAFKTMITEHAPTDELSVTVRRAREVLVTVVKTKADEAARKGGELAKAWIGMKTQVLTPEVATALGLDGAKGFRVTDVYPWTKAAAAGLAQGDVIVSFDGEPLTASRPQDVRELQRLVEDRSIGEEIALGIMREKKAQTVAVTLEESPVSATEVKKHKQDDIEVTVRELTFMDKIQNQWDMDWQGVVVAEVTSGGWASMAGLRTNDLIVSIDDQTTPDVKAFEELSKSWSVKQPKALKIFVRRRTSTTFVIVEPEWKAKG